MCCIVLTVNQFCVVGCTIVCQCCHSSLTLPTFESFYRRGGRVQIVVFQLIVVVVSCLAVRAVVRNVQGHEGAGKAVHGERNCGQDLFWVKANAIGAVRANFSERSVVFRNDSCKSQWSLEGLSGFQDRLPKVDDGGFDVFIHDSLCVDAPVDR